MAKVKQSMNIVLVSISYRCVAGHEAQLVAASNYDDLWRLRSQISYRLLNDYCGLRSKRIVAALVYKDTYLQNIMVTLSMK